MSKWADDFAGKYKDTNTVKRLNQEIKDALNKKKMQRQVDQDISNVIKGKCKRKGGNY